MMLKPALAAVSLLFAVSAASANTIFNVGGATLTYDDSTSLGNIGSFNGFEFEGFSWNLPNSATVVNTTPDTIEFLTVDLPSFTITANPGFALSDISGFLGNPTFFDFGGTSNIQLTAEVSIDGGPAIPISGLIDFVITNQNLSIGLNAGFFSQTATLPGAFTTFAVTNASLLLTAAVDDDGTISSIVSNPQNKLEISYTVVAVPEPETGAMLLAGLAAMGWVARRQRKV